MQNLKRLLVAVTLSVALGGPALADCPAPIPGEINAPPCTSTQQSTDDLNNQTTNTMEAISTEAEIITLDTVISGLENLLTVY